MTHVHTPNPEWTTTRSFCGPVPGAEENRAAHGNICVCETCACGAQRDINANQRHEEVGPWEPHVHKTLEAPTAEFLQKHRAWTDRCECGAMRRFVITSEGETRYPWMGGRYV